MSKKLPVLLKPNEPESLLRAADTERDRLIGLCLLMLGLRVSEVVKLQVEHVDTRRRTLWVRDGKGGRDRAIPLPKILVGPLRGWIGSRTSGPVFRSRKGGKQLTTRAVQHLVKRLAVKAGLPEAEQARKFHPHALRHLFASRLLEGGATIYEVKELMGHANISTTERYLHLLGSDRLRDAIDRPYSS